MFIKAIHSQNQGLPWFTRNITSHGFLSIMIEYYCILKSMTTTNTFKYLLLRNIFNIICLIPYIFLTTPHVRKIHSFPLITRQCDFVDINHTGCYLNI